jgi:predicted regulator of Ras-like GTPase activity (Roadblock/LC7/MglB family)
MQTIITSLEKLAHFPGILGCALVEADTGMVWHHAGQQNEMERVGEAAVEFWRTQGRVAEQLGMLGELKFASYNYGQRTIGLIPCDLQQGLILVCLAQNPGVVWGQWMQELPAFRQLVKAFGLRQQA